MRKIFIANNFFLHRIIPGVCHDAFMYVFFSGFSQSFLSLRAVEWYFKFLLLMLWKLTWTWTYVCVYNILLRFGWHQYCITLVFSVQQYNVCVCNCLIDTRSLHAMVSCSCTGCRRMWCWRWMWRLAGRIGQMGHSRQCGTAIHCCCWTCPGEWLSRMSLVGFIR